MRTMIHSASLWAVLLGLFGCREEPPVASRPPPPPPRVQASPSPPPLPVAARVLAKGPPSGLRCDKRASVEDPKNRKCARLVVDNGTEASARVELGGGTLTVEAGDALGLVLSPGMLELTVHGAEPDTHSLDVQARHVYVYNVGAKRDYELTTHWYGHAYGKGVVADVPVVAHPFFDAGPVDLLFERAPKKIRTSSLQFEGALRALLRVERADEPRPEVRRVERQQGAALHVVALQPGELVVTVEEQMALASAMVHVDNVYDEAMTVRLDGAPVAEVERGGHLRLRVVPGPHVLEAAGADGVHERLEPTVDAGARYIWGPQGRREYVFESWFIVPGPEPFEERAKHTVRGLHFFETTAASVFEPLDRVEIVDKSPVSAVHQVTRGRIADHRAAVARELTALWAEAKAALPADRYEQLRARSPDPPEPATECDLWSARGRLAEAAGKLDDAQALYEQAIETPPCEASGFRDRALLLAQKGDCTQARRDYRSAVEREPDASKAMKAVLRVCPL